METQKYKDLFLSEAREHLDSLDSGLLTLEKGPNNPELIKEMMRHSHSLKGMAATMGYGELSNLSHSFEGMLENLKNGISKPNVQILFGALDELRSLLSEIEYVDPDIGPEKGNKKLNPLVEVIGELATQDSKNNESIIRNPENFRKISEIKVSIEKLDKLLEIVSELSINKFQFEEEIKSLPSNVRELIENNSKFINELQYIVLKLRLTPMEQVFNRFPRMVRDLSKKLNKEIEFEIFGNEIEVDKEILDNIAEPIVHLLRNSIDHGIEKAGKILLGARQQEQMIVITVSDDGKGINWGRVEEKLGRKLETVEERENAIFSGVSTNNDVTEISGRGIGLYTVKNSVERLGGHLKLRSEINKGTNFEIHLPISATIMKAIICTIADQTYAIPLNNIEKIVFLNEFEVFSQASQDMIILDQTEVPLVDLSQKLTLSKAYKKQGSRSTNKYYNKKIALITKIDESRYAFVIDSLEGEQDIIVKPLPEEIRKKVNLSAVTILGNGKPVPVLDFAYLMDTV